MSASGSQTGTAAREARGLHGRALSAEQAALAARMHGNGESATTIAKAVGVSRATVYRVLADNLD